ncbi:hypothetical protein [Streptomyces sp. NPDC006368]|uniref:hypothetical protein n=1 Tax=Streptomyces sp. NPDC006368 TaxID=3156760 RepID=UPI0033B7B710
MAAASPVKEGKDTKGGYGRKPFAGGPYQFDAYAPGTRTRAREALVGCGRPDGFTTNIAVPNDKRTHIDAAESLRAAPKQVGIDLRVKKLDPQPLVDGRFIAPSNNPDLAQVNDPDINNLLDRAIAETDPDRAAQAYRTVSEKVTEGRITCHSSTRGTSSGAVLG